MAAYRCVLQGHQHALLRSQPHSGEPGSSLCVETSLRGVYLHMDSSLFCQLIIPFVRSVRITGLLHRSPESG